MNFKQFLKKETSLDNSSLFKFEVIEQEKATALFDFYQQFNNEGMQKEFLCLPQSSTEIIKTIYHSDKCYLTAQDRKNGQIVAAQKLTLQGIQKNPFFYSEDSFLSQDKIIGMSTMYVSPLYRKQGITSSLLKLVQKAGESTGYQAIVFDCDVRNKTAMEAYQRLASPYGLVDGTQNKTQNEATGYFIWLYCLGSLFKESNRSFEMNLSTINVDQNIKEVINELKQLGRLDVTECAYGKGINRLYTLNKPLKIKSSRIFYRERD